MKNLSIILGLIASLFVVALVHSAPILEQTECQDASVVICPAMDHQLVIDSVDYTYSATSDVSQVYVMNVSAPNSMASTFTIAYRAYVNSEGYRWPPSRYVCASAVCDTLRLQGLLQERRRYGLNMSLPVTRKGHRAQYSQRRI